MIALILRFLKHDDFTGVSPKIDRAKGMYKIETNLKKEYKRRKRIQQWQ
jgi:hypothetical protein